MSAQACAAVWVSVFDIEYELCASENVPHWKLSKHCGIQRPRLRWIPADNGFVCKLPSIKSQWIEKVSIFNQIQDCWTGCLMGFKKNLVQQILLFNYLFTLIFAILRSSSAETQADSSLCWNKGITRQLKRSWKGVHAGQLLVLKRKCTGQLLVLKRGIWRTAPSAEKRNMLDSSWCCKEECSGQLLVLKWRTYWTVPGSAIKNILDSSWCWNK